MLVKDSFFFRYTFRCHAKASVCAKQCAAWPRGYSIGRGGKKGATTRPSKPGLRGERTGSPVDEGMRFARWTLSCGWDPTG